VEASALHAPVGLGRISLSTPLLKLRSDEQLVALFRAGNDEAFRVIHDRYSQRLFAYSRQMLSGSRQDAEDALQDVFIRAYGALRASDRPVALRAWLYRVAHNRCVDQLRRPLPPAADLFDAMRPPLPDALTEAERREDLRRLIADVRRLPAQQRSVLLMRELEGLSYADLAAALGVSVPAVKSLLVRARMGLVEAAEARDTACTEIRRDLTLAHGRGVRANGRARRHLRDCAGCRAYRSEMRRLERSFASLAPLAPGPLALLAKLGIGGSGGGAAAGGGAAVSGSATAAGGGLIGSGAAALTATKVAAVVSAVVVAGGGAVKVEQQIEKRVQEDTVTPAAVTPRAEPAPTEKKVAQAIEAPAKTEPPAAVTEEAMPDAATTAPDDAAAADPAMSDQVLDTTSPTGGMAAPDDSAGDEAGAGSTKPASGDALTPADSVTPALTSDRTGHGAAPTGSAAGNGGSTSAAG
jgi:RNA polymerase sigma factor (sigma-70 family)